MTQNILRLLFNRAQEDTTRSVSHSAVQKLSLEPPSCFVLTVEVLAGNFVDKPAGLGFRGQGQDPLQANSMRSRNKKDPQRASGQRAISPIGDACLDTHIALLVRTAAEVNEIAGNHHQNFPEVFSIYPSERMASLVCRNASQQSSANGIQKDDETGYLLRIAQVG